MDFKAFIIAYIFNFIKFAALKLSTIDFFWTIFCSKKKNWFLITLTLNLLAENLHKNCMNIYGKKYFLFSSWNVIICIYSISNFSLFFFNFWNQLQLWIAFMAANFMSRNFISGFEESKKQVDAISSWYGGYSLVFIGFSWREN